MPGGVTGKAREGLPMSILFCFFVFFDACVKSQITHNTNSLKFRKLSEVHKKNVFSVAFGGFCRKLAQAKK